MDSHYADNFSGSFQNIIPNYNPQVDAKGFPPQQQQPSEAGQHFNLMSNVMYQPAATAGGYSPIHDANNLYSDLDAINETPQLMHNNMGDMELYDADPLDTEMINTNHTVRNEANVFQTSSMNQQTIFNYEEPKLAHFNNIVQVAVPNSNPILSHSNIQSRMGQSVIQQPPTIQASVPDTPMDPIPTSSFYQSNYNPAVATPLSESSEAVEPPPSNGMEALNNGIRDSMDIRDDEVPLSVAAEVGDVDDAVETNGDPETDPLANEAETADRTNENGGKVEEAENNGEENGDGGKGELEKCVREGCDKTAIVNSEWEDEYCSNECCIKHCTTVFKAWVQENLKTTHHAQNEGTTVM